MKKLLVLATLSLGILVGCASQKTDETVKIGIVGEAERVIWAPIVEEFAQKGTEIEIITFSDYQTPNRALNDGEIDLNAFQHYAFLNDQIASTGYEIESLGNTYISATNIYSGQLTSLDQLKEGDKVAIANDATNQGRALKVLEGAGLIEIDPVAGDSPDETHIISNPLNLEIIPMDAASVAITLPDVAIGVINGNYALDFGLNPNEDAIFIDSPENYTTDVFYNLIAVKSANKDNTLYQEILASYQSEKTIDIYNTEFKGSYLKAWQ